MKHPAIPALCCALLAAAFTQNVLAAETSEAIVPKQRIQLFNGKDFRDWTFCLLSNAQPANTFTITNGLMRCAGQPYGYVRTEKNYRDYKLTVEWRLVRVAPRADNSGVIVHVQSPDAIWPKAVENQGQFHHQGNLILMGGATCAGHETPQTRSIRMNGQQNENPVGEWNTYEVICSGNSLTNFVNGRQMNAVSGLSVSSGAIAIQSEGGEWELRTAFLEPLVTAQ